MRPDRITKLYDGLNNKERAALAFGYLADANELELDRVAATVPRRTYVCPEIEFRAWFDGFFNLACMWAIEHWKARSRNLGALAGMHVMLGLGEIDKARAMFKATKRWESSLLALDRALVAVCKEHGGDPDAVRRVAGAEPFEPTFADTAVDSQYQTDIQSNLSRVLTGATCD